MKLKRIVSILMFIIILSVGGASYSHKVKATVVDRGQSTGTVSFYGSYPSSENDKKNSEGEKKSSHHNVGKTSELPETGEQENFIVRFIGVELMLLASGLIILNSKKKEKRGI